SLEQPEAAGAATLVSIAALYNLDGQAGPEETMLEAALAALASGDASAHSSALASRKAVASAVVLEVGGEAGEGGGGGAGDYAEYRFAKAALLAERFNEAEARYRALLASRSSNRPSKPSAEHLASGREKSASGRKARPFEALDACEWLPLRVGGQGRGELVSDATVLHEWVEALLQSGEPLQALQACDRILAGNADDEPALRHKADALVLLERADEALIPLERQAIILKARLDKARQGAAAKKQQGSSRSVMEVEDGGGAERAAKLALADCYNNRGLADAAEAALRAAIQLADNNLPHCTASPCAGQPDAAEAALRAAIQLADNNLPEASYNLSLFLWGENRRMDAATHWMAARGFARDSSPEECRALRNEALSALQSEGRRGAAESHVGGRLRLDQMRTLDVMLLDCFSQEMEDMLAAALCDSLGSQ
ncbi:hypothetical protein T484DRAFT_1834863, partial [Baffinella frigidus]